MQAIILAGGMGTRLRPYTTVIPKPLMPLGNHAVIELVLHQLKRAGFSRVIISLGYLGQLIQAYISSISLPGLEISYIWEKTPLGTAGPLSLIENLDEQFLVMNGDVLTDLDFNEMFQSSKNREDDITVAVYPRKVMINLGVLKLGEDQRILDYIEKPEYPYLASMGIYVIRKSAVQGLPRGEKKDLPDFVLEAIENNQAVRAFQFDGFWLDIGRIDDYQEAQDNLPDIQEKLGLQDLISV